MDIERSALFSVMLIGVLASGGCDDKVKVDRENRESHESRDKTAASEPVPSPAVSDSDTTDETATSAPPAPEAQTKDSSRGCVASHAADD